MYIKTSNYGNKNYYAYVKYPVSQVNVYQPAGTQRFMTGILYTQYLYMYDINVKLKLECFLKSVVVTYTTSSGVGRISEGPNTTAKL